MKVNKTRSVLACLVVMASANISNAATMAFVGFNADGFDGYSLATFEPIPTGTVINFTDDEWTGSAFLDSNEADWRWTATSDLAAGTVLNFLNMTNIYSGSPAASVSSGTVAPVTVGGTNAGYSTTAEVIYAYTGTRAAPNFLAVISSGEGNLAGLTGAQAIQLAPSSDGAKYIGARTGEYPLSDFLPLVADVSNNWSDVGNGTGDNNFDPTPFTVPEPTTFSLVGISCFALSFRRR
jgi:hypothetical protein